MTSTSLTLLERLHQHGHADDWDRFLRLYTPVLLFWARRQGFHDADAEDLTQIILLKLLRVLPTYQRREGHSFRGWLFTICRNECHDFRRRVATRRMPSDEGLSGLEAPVPEHEVSETEYYQQIVARALEIIQRDFTESTWKLFTGFVLEGRSAKDVAKEASVTVNSVYLARHRVLTRIREQLAGMLD